MAHKLKYIALIVLSSLLLGSCSKTEDVQYEIITVQPLYDDIYDRCMDDEILGFPESVTHEPDLLIYGANRLSDSLNNVSYKDENNLKNCFINKDLFQSFGQNQIILIQSHGEYDSDYHSTIITGEDYIESNYERDDLDEARVVESNMFNSDTCYNYSAITGYFVDKYCPNICGSIVYLGECFGIYDYYLATSFLNKGAACVIGSTLAINMHYGDMMQYKIVELLGEVNPLTNNYYSVYEAISKAKELYGKTDDEKYTYANGAEILAFGDTSVRLKNKA